MSQTSVLLLFGGVSSEHEVSCMSVSSVYENIDREKYKPFLMGITKKGEWYLYSGKIDRVRDNTWEKDRKNLKKAYICPDRGCHGIMVEKDGKLKKRHIDVVFPVLHGKNGEDGTMQGLLEIAGLPYVGCDVLSSAMCMDKDVCHTVLKAAGVPQVAWLSYLKDEDYEKIRKETEKKLGYPVFIKPANAGSSVGITKVHNAEELPLALSVAFSNDRKIVIEKAVEDPIEIECAVLGNDELRAGGPGEVVPADEFYTYDAKYFNEKSMIYIPARIEPEQAEKVRTIAKKAYKALGCSGMARVDFLINGKTGEIVLNEPNTLPGFTNISMYPKLLISDGMTYPEVISSLLELALKK